MFQIQLSNKTIKIEFTSSRGEGDFKELGFSSKKGNGRKMQRIIYKLRVRKKKSAHIFLFLYKRHKGITCQCYNDHLWRVRVQVSSIFFFILVKGSPQSPLLPGCISSLNSPLPECNGVALTAPGWLSQ